MGLKNPKSGDRTKQGNPETKRKSVPFNDNRPNYYWQRNLMFSKLQGERLKHFCVGVTDTVNRDDRKQGNYITLEGHLSNWTLKHPSTTKWGMRSFLLLKRKFTIRSLNKWNNITRVERLLLGDALHSTDVHRSFSISSYDEISKCMKTIMLRSVLQSNQIYMDLFFFHSQ